PVVGQAGQRGRAADRAHQVRDVAGGRDSQTIRAVHGAEEGDAVALGGGQRGVRVDERGAAVVLLAGGLDQAAVNGGGAAEHVEGRQRRCVAHCFVEGGGAVCRDGEVAGAVHRVVERDVSAAGRGEVDRARHGEGAVVLRAVGLHGDTGQRGGAA